jgi:glycosyltransferase involved in cell wall biosynthesis
MQGETILCVASYWRWRSMWRDSQQIMSRLAPANRVLFFEGGRDAVRPVLPELWRNLPNVYRLRYEEVSENIFAIPTPSALPHARRVLPRPVLRVTVPIVTRLNAWLLVHHIRRAMRAFDVSAPILWIYNPYHAALPGHFGEKLVCYYNQDEHADMSPNQRVSAILRRLDRELCRRADVIFATSRAQTEHRRAINPATYFVPNGVDFDLFHRALDPSLSLPDDIAALPRPIVGFAGWLGYHIDTELLVAIAQAYPRSSLVLVGPDELPQSASRRQLDQFPNVFFVGQKERADLPHYLKAFDVALMPYALRGHIYAAYPLKLHEYLAAGRSIVATDLPELRPFADVVRIGADYGACIAHIAAALDDHTPESIEARVAVARENTWDQRISTIERVLDQLLARRGHQEGGT